MGLFSLTLCSVQARRTGAVETDRKTTGGTNKARQGTPAILPASRVTHKYLSNRTDTDHQKIAMLDRKDDVAPPPKVNPTVGKAWNFDNSLWSTF